MIMAGVHQGAAEVLGKKGLRFDVQINCNENIEIRCTQGLKVKLSLHPSAVITEILRRVSETIIDANINIIFVIQLLDPNTLMAV
jgi:hypothetical protein